MLYLSTRSKTDSFTAYRVLHSDCAPDGGMFMPMQIPVQDDVALASFERMNFGEAIASILNLFFGSQLSGWDIDFAVQGRCPINECRRSGGQLLTNDQVMEGARQLIKEVL